MSCVFSPDPRTQVISPASVGWAVVIWCQSSLRWSLSLRGVTECSGWCGCTKGTGHSHSDWWPAGGVMHTCSESMAYFRGWGVWGFPRELGTVQWGQHICCTLDVQPHSLSELMYRYELLNWMVLHMLWQRFRTRCKYNQGEYYLLINLFVKTLK